MRDRRQPPLHDAVAAEARSRRWRAATAAEDQLAAVEAELQARQLAGDDHAVRALRREARLLRSAHARLVALDALSWPLRDDAHAEAMAQLERASAQLASASADHPVARAIASEAQPFEDTTGRAARKSRRSSNRNPPGRRST